MRAAKSVAAPLARYAAWRRAGDIVIEVEATAYIRQKR